MKRRWRELPVQFIAAWRRNVALGSDVLNAGLAWYLAFKLRFNFEIPPDFAWVLKKTLWVVVPCQLLFFLFFGLYRGLWRFASLPDLKRILLAVAGSVPTAALLLLLMGWQVGVPRSVWVLFPLLLVSMMMGSRVLYRIYKDYRQYGWSTFREGTPVLVLGAGSTGSDLARELSRSRQWRIVGLLDDNEKIWGRSLYGFPILGSVRDLPRFSEQFAVRHVILAMPSAGPEVAFQVFKTCKELDLQLLTVPRIEDLISRRVTVSQVRQLEIEDLLGRKPVELDGSSLGPMLSGKAVMVTGAGGSIGSELCRQIARYRPRLLLLYELSEPALYHLDQELRELAVAGMELRPVIGDVKDAARLEATLAAHKPDLLFHAAAYKHVPLMEESGNGWEAVRNNAVGTLLTAQAAMRHHVEKFILVSTDKAVNPTNVMGATKRLCEMLCQGIQKNSVTRFVVVRFGNVLGSNGSVIPRFRAQIQRGGPITVTHPEMARFFMSIPEASQLVLQAAALGEGGEIFVLDMGSSIKIVDLARDMIRLSGFSEEQIKIEFTGLRAGEKLFEELVADGEEALATPHPKLSVLRARPVTEEWMTRCTAWLGAEKVLSDQQVREGLQQLLAEYLPADANKSLLFH